MKNSTKKCAIKQKRKYEYYKNFFEAAQLENKINKKKTMNLMWIVLEKIV